MEPMSWLKATSDIVEKLDNCSRKEGKYSTSITNISITLSHCLGQSENGFPIQTPFPSPTNKHTHSRVGVHLHTQHINENHLQLHHSAWHLKIVSACVFVRALGLFRINFTCVEAQIHYPLGVVYISPGTSRNLNSVTADRRYNQQQYL